MNPAKIKVYEEAWKQEENRKNTQIHAYVGSYVLSALYTSIGNIFGDKKKGKVSYIDRPIRLFEMTEEEKLIEQEKAIQAFIQWAGYAETKYKDKEGG